MRLSSGQPALWTTRPVLWFLGSINWPWLRFQLRFGDPIVTVTSATTVMIAVLWLTVIGLYAYSDRPSRQSPLVSVSLAVFFSVTSYIALFSLALRAGL